MSKEYTRRPDNDEPAETIIVRRRSGNINYPSGDVPTEGAVPSLNQHGGAGPLDNTVLVNRSGSGSGGGDRLEPTREADWRGNPSGTTGAGAYADVGKTTVIRPGQPGPKLDEPSASGDAFGAVQPVVGWLVVTGGPGMGAFRPIHYGNNTVGRDPKANTIALDFGDTSISSSEQAYIRYDHVDRRFLLIPNLARANVVAVNSTRPLGPVELEPFAELTVGSTTLRFVPFCGRHFDWSDIVGE